MSLPVLIIGSGLGGLTLAHSLQKSGIPYRIFERDAAKEQRAQGYRIGLDSVGVDALRVVIAPRLFDRFEASCGEQHHPGGRIDGPSGKVLQSGLMGLIGAGGWGLVWDLASRYLWKRWEGLTWEGIMQITGWSSQPRKRLDLTIPPGPDKRYQVDRRVLRAILLTDQAQHITFESTFTHYTTSADSVTAHFADGTSATGSLLVGADGVRSKVAAQLIGQDAAPQDLGYRIIYGKTPLSIELGDKVHETLRKGTSFVVDTTSDGQGILMVQESMRFSHQADLGTPDDYVFWGLTAKDKVFDAAGKSVEGDIEITKLLTSRWRADIKCLIDQQDTTQTASLRMRTSNPEGPTTWETNRRVTLLGDAIHCMPPTGGQGANLAMRDGATLGLALNLAKGEAEDGWKTDTLRQYEDAMRHNQGDIVGMACIGVRRIVP